MKNETIFKSRQYGVSEELVSKSFGGYIPNVDILNLWSISVSPSGHGHYKIEASFYVNDEKMERKTSTNNMQLIDAWKSGMNDMYEDGEDGFDNWDEVVIGMMSEINAEDDIIEYSNM